jgi:hypothetical protein
MPLALFLSVALLAEPPPPKLALVSLTGSGLEAARVEVWGDYFAEQLSKRGLSVITPGAIAATLGLAVVRA